MCSRCETFSRQVKDSAMRTQIQNAAVSRVLAGRDRRYKIAMVIWGVVAFEAFVCGFFLGREYPLHPVRQAPVVIEDEEPHPDWPREWFSVIV